MGFKLFETPWSYKKDLVVGHITAETFLPTNYSFDAIITDHRTLNYMQFCCQSMAIMSVNTYFPGNQLSRGK